MKKCSCCKVEKDNSDFTKNKSNSDGLEIYCKPCRKLKKQVEYLKHKDKYLARSEKQRKENPEKVSEVKKLCRLKKIDQYKERAKAYRVENKESIVASNKLYREKNKDLINARDRKYYQRNRANYLQKQAEYQKLNAEARNAYTRQYRKSRRKTDRLFGIRQNMRARFRYELAKRGDSTHIKANEYLGCSWLFLRDYLAQKFTDGMSWNNYGEWHIDHIMPLASANTKDDLIKLCHYSNLQPLWAFDNLSKGAKIPDKAA
ncbi:hypothetical protein G9F31_00825 [Acinetobacter sp. 187]|uniref:hypothetical protein n=1 Tax=Acinetobacter lanii TaxID=2715163 RepID=UPI0014095EFC|nr:hypothetical protein [Acinetobacter lanii]NHC02328.1 hypothetical protein [Acinetobacter lanii]